MSKYEKENQSLRMTIHSTSSSGPRTQRWNNGMGQDQEPRRHWTYSMQTSLLPHLPKQTIIKLPRPLRILDRATVKPLRSLMNDLRNIKSDAEIDNMRLAGKASGRAFTSAMRQSWTLEKDLTAYLEYKFKRNGCDTSAYVPVVAGGKNASQIHYVRNDDVLLDNDLVLADAGGVSLSFSLFPTQKSKSLTFLRKQEYGNYITDITRSWPISGTFSPPQKDLYNAILATQRTCISLCRASSCNSLDKLHQIAENTLRDSLKDLGFDMSGNALETLFPHHLGHYIGLDVHDTPGQSRKAPLEA
ncbi:MAG: hypothetical protein Q9183_004905, partial [Haloplaca sp. 2 TL-2023]